MPSSGGSATSSSPPRRSSGAGVTVGWPADRADAARHPARSPRSTATSATSSAAIRFATLDLSNSRAVSFAGVNPRFNRFTINGVQVGDNFGLNPDANPTGRGPVPFDAIGQFSVSIAPYDIRQGNFQGGAIDTVLLSGTNEFHGTGFYSQNRDELQGKRIGVHTRVNAGNYKSETYGATLSRPDHQDKLFFMVSAERNTDPRPLAVTSAGQTRSAQRLTRRAASANVHEHRAVASIATIPAAS